MAFTATATKNFPDYETGEYIEYTYTSSQWPTEEQALWEVRMWATAIESLVTLEEHGYRSDLPFLVSELFLYMNPVMLSAIKRRAGEDAVFAAYTDAVPELVRLLGSRFDIEAIIADTNPTDPIKADSRKEITRILKWLTIKNLYGAHEVVPPTTWVNIKKAYDDIKSLKTSTGWCHDDYIVAQTDPPTDGFGAVIDYRRDGLFKDNEY